MDTEKKEMKQKSTAFTGNIYLFQAFDVGDDIDLEKIKNKQLLLRRPLAQPKYFKNYHVPLAVDLPHPHAHSSCLGAKLHSFGVIALVYKIPFSQTLQELREEINEIDQNYNEQSVADAGSIFKIIKPYIKQPRFFHLRSSYVLIQVDPQPESISVVKLKEEFGGGIASLLRFETESLSEFQMNEILEGAIGYYRGDLLIIDTEAAFLYDEDYTEILDLFEFANLQHLELQYYDKLLDQQLTAVYEREVKKLPYSAYLPLVGTLKTDTVSELGNMKVDISVITERLESNIRLASEPYYGEMYSLLLEKLDLETLKDSINKKLAIIYDISSVYQHKVDAAREDLLSVLVILLILIEVIIGLMHYFK